MRISLLVLSVLLVLPCLVCGQQSDATDSLQGDNNANNGDLEGKGEDASNDNENKEEAKPRKTSFKEERFEKLFNNRLRKPRLPAPKYHQKPKPKLPSFIKNPPSVKPLGQDGLPVDDVPRPTTPSSRAKTVNSRASVSKTTTSAPRTQRGRISSTTTTAKPSVVDSNKRFSSSSRGRLSNSSSNSSNNIPASGGRNRLNK